MSSLAFPATIDIVAEEGQRKERKRSMQFLELCTKIEPLDRERANFSFEPLHNLPETVLLEKKTTVRPRKKIRFCKIVSKVNTAEKAHFL